MLGFFRKNTNVFALLTLHFMTLKSYGIVQISKNMHPLQGVVDYDVVWYRFTISSRIPSLTSAPVPAEQPWKVWVNRSHGLIGNSKLNHTKAQQNRVIISLYILYYHFVSSATKTTLQWRHNERDGVSNHQPHDCLLKGLFRGRSNKTSKFRVTGLCARNSPVTGEFPT